MRFPDPVTLINPGETTEDEDTGNDVAGPPVEKVTRGSLQSLQTSTEAADGSTTVIAKYVLLLPPDEVASSQTIVEADGGRFEVVGDVPLIRTGAGIPSHKHLALNRVSDLQDAPEETP